MSTKKALKIVVCGPAKGGKTSIANFIAGHTEQLGNQSKIYDPTVGVRYPKSGLIFHHVLVRLLLTIRRRSESSAQSGQRSPLYREFSLT